MSSYKVLQKQVFEDENFSIVPIRFEDRMDILKWRNEQIFHLRQNKPLTIKNQDNYFATVVAELFEQDKPNQILFSYLENGVCIGYGGLVHINWIDKNAEISFVMNTKLEKDSFKFYWKNYISLIEKVAFEELSFHKIFTFAFDLRPHLYEVLLDCKFKEEARLSEHCFFDNKFIDVVIHSKINNQLC
ncbi:GNAT family N-acetyltransferase [Flavobacteriaceae bacterium]|nr:GNAT family N-acetyltransferase [Flavobacteriaceae bacterium]